MEFLPFGICHHFDHNTNTINLHSSASHPSLPASCIHPPALSVDKEKKIDYLFGFHCVLRYLRRFDIGFCDCFETQAVLKAITRQHQNDYSTQLHFAGGYGAVFDAALRGPPIRSTGRRLIIASQGSIQKELVSPSSNSEWGCQSTRWLLPKSGSKCAARSKS